MDKPISLSVKNFLIRKMAVSLMVPEKTIEAVVNHQFNTMIDATSSTNSVELSGFGKFLFNRRKADKRMVKYVTDKKMYEDMLLQEMTEQKRAKLQLKLDIINNNIKALSPKLHD